MRRTYNPVKRVRARSEGPNPSGPAICYHRGMKKKIIVEKPKFDAVLSQLLKTPPIPMKQIKTAGKRPKGSFIPKRSES
jgi:hypothetical protein